MQTEETGIAHVKSVIGAAAYNDLVDAMPGKRLTIPNTATPNHPITAVIGIELANKLCDECFGLQIELPVGGKKHKLILAALENGENHGVIAQRFFVTRRFVLKLKKQLNACKTGELQQELF